MESFKKRWRALILLLGISAVLTTVLSLTETSMTAPADLERIPLVLGDYVGTEIPVEQSVKDILETPNVLMRGYTSSDGINIVLAIVYYEQYRVYFHMPEGCMVGRGSVIVASETEELNAGSSTAFLEANKLVLKQRDGSEYVYYYFFSGNLITPSYPKMRFHLMMEHLKRRPTGAALVRFSIHSDVENAEKRVAELKSFIRQFSPFLPEYLS